MNNKHASLALVIILSLCAYSYIVRQESKALLVALKQTDAGFIEFMTMSVGGKKLFEYVNPNSVGTFKIGKNSYACAKLNSPLPVRPP